MTKERKVFLLEASRVQVGLKQEVMPDTVLGEDFESGKQVTAGVQGVVEGISLMGAEHAIYVVIKCDANSEEHDDEVEDGILSQEEGNGEENEQ